MTFKKPSFSTNAKEIRRFGMISVIVFGTFASVAWWRGKLLPFYFFCSLGGLGLLFFSFPEVMKPVFVRWQRLTQAIGRLTNIVILSVAYYVVITPFAWGKRFFGDSPLPLSPDKNAKTYWQERRPPLQQGDRFYKRY